MVQAMNLLSNISPFGGKSDFKEWQRKFDVVIDECEIPSEGWLQLIHTYLKHETLRFYCYLAKKLKKAQRLFEPIRRLYLGKFFKNTEPEMAKKIAGHQEIKNTEDAEKLNQKFSPASQIYGTKVCANISEAHQSSMINEVIKNQRVGPKDNGVYSNRRDQPCETWQECGMPYQEVCTEKVLFLTLFVEKMIMVISQLISLLMVIGVVESSTMDPLLL
ncbi:hypothetical protein RF11_13719 [Thelohanellus kitauei]|uniref:Uncharacterized protein n=1 Tax=Thelohanellus kitauei TaxID=669202 RepID=A0A0C2J8E5_THEKT|nr:hypothetical protein RF11_13719 [Thelohanellus kitauei]